MTPSPQTSTSSSAGGLPTRISTATLPNFNPAATSSQSGSRFLFSKAFDKVNCTLLHQTVSSSTLPPTMWGGWWRFCRVAKWCADIAIPRRSATQCGTVISPLLFNYFVSTVQLQTGYADDKYAARVVREPANSRYCYDSPCWGCEPLSKEAWCSNLCSQITGRPLYPWLLALKLSSNSYPKLVSTTTRALPQIHWADARHRAHLQLSHPNNSSEDLKQTRNQEGSRWHNLGAQKETIIITFNPIKPAGIYTSHRFRGTYVREVCITLNFMNRFSSFFA